MQEAIVGTRTCLDEQGTPHTFCYSLITQHIPAGRFSFEDYGVKVEEAGGGSACLPSVTHSRTRIDALLVLLMEHVVSPIGLSDTVEDWVKETRLPRSCGRRVTEE